MSRVASSSASSRCRRAKTRRTGTISSCATMRLVRRRWFCTKCSKPSLRRAMVSSASQASARLGAARHRPGGSCARHSSTRSRAVAASEEIGVSEFITSCAMTRMTVCQAASSWAVSSVSIFCSEISRRRTPLSARSVAAALSCSAPDAALHPHDRACRPA